LHIGWEEITWQQLKLRQLAKLIYTKQRRIEAQSMSMGRTINVNGSFAGGSLVVGYRNDNGLFTPYTNNALLTADGEWVINSGPGVLLMVNFFGGTGSPTVNVEHHGHYDG